MTTPRGGPPKGARNAAHGDRNKVAISVRISADMADAIDESQCSPSEMLAALIDAALAHIIVRAYAVEDGGCYAIWRDADGVEHETQITAATELQAKFHAVIEWNDWRK